MLEGLELYFAICEWEEALGRSRSRSSSPSSSSPGEVGCGGWERHFACHCCGRSRSRSSSPSSSSRQEELHHGCGRGDGQAQKSSPSVSQHRSCHCCGRSSSSRQAELEWRYSRTRSCWLMKWNTSLWKRTRFRWSSHESGWQPHYWSCVE